MAQAGAGVHQVEQPPAKPTGNQIHPSIMQPWQLKLGQFFFMAVLFRLPFFDVACDPNLRCAAPLDVVALELYAYDRLPAGAIKALLYPGAFMENLSGIVAGEPTSLPTWESVLDPYENVTYREPWSSGLPTSVEAVLQQRLLLLAGSFMALGGAVLALLGPSVMGTCGVLLVAGHVYLERRAGRDATPQFYLAMGLFTSLYWLPLHKLLSGEAFAAPRKKSKLG